MTTYRCLILDLDGTVVDSHAYTFAAFRHACVPFRTPPADAEILAAFGPDEAVILRGLVGAQAAPAAYARLQVYYREHVRDLRLRPEMRALLDDCGRAGIRRGLFTGRGSESTRLVLAALDLGLRFDAVVAGDQARPKPAADGVRVLLATLGAAAAETLLVGDSELDSRRRRARARIRPWRSGTGAHCLHPARASGIPTISSPFSACAEGSGRGVA